MGIGVNGGCNFPLTSLQIGDLRSYLSDISLFLANDSKKVYILVDNRPWLRDLGYWSAHFWQLMITKSRLSPFAITKTRRGRKEEKEICSVSCSPSQPKNFLKWFSLIDAATLSREKVLLPVEKLSNSLQFSSELLRTLHGFIVFEVAWTNVRGINYFSELQTDASLAIETKLMQRWEFDDIAQAVSCISSWFSGTLSEQIIMKEHLDSAAARSCEQNEVAMSVSSSALFSGELFYDASQEFSGTIPIDGDDNICNSFLTVKDSSVHCLGGNVSVYSENTEQTTSMPHTPPLPSGPCKRRKVLKSFSMGSEVDSYSEEMLGSIDDSLTNSETSSCTSDDAVEVTQYSDVLILFRFNDRNLPFKLREVIMSDLRLLTLLEAGLPAWVIFLQSYPVLCHLYRPWMCPLARVLYVLISFVTVLIGFYDLYKNVPVLKATASHLCGPLFDWIETWEMVSRVRYLGTMLFLHNFQKAVRWSLALTHTSRHFFSVLLLPLQPLFKLFGFLLPTFNMLFGLVEDIFSVVWGVIGTLFDIVGDVLELFFSPLWFIVTFVWNTATTILYPIFWIVWEILYAPIRLVLAVSSVVAFICTCICDIVGDAWLFASSIFQLASSSEATVTASVHEVSMLRSLWNDLFSQIFRAIRSILYGFVAFFTACNRHRLSIYNHLQEFIKRLYHQCQRSQNTDLRRDDRTCRAPNLVEETVRSHTE